MADWIYTNFCLLLLGMSAGNRWLIAAFLLIGPLRNALRRRTWKASLGQVLNPNTFLIIFGLGSGGVWFSDYPAGLNCFLSLAGIVMSWLTWTQSEYAE